MARNDDPARRQRRAFDDLVRALGRRDLDRALDAFVQLPPPARAPATWSLVVLFRDEVQRQHARAGWGRLHLLATRADAAPELLTHDATPEVTATFAWPLAWAAGIARDVPRAERLFAHVRRWLDEASPALADLVARWIAGRTAAPGTASDPRLGVEPVRPRGAARQGPPPPASVPEVSRAAIALYATQPWNSFATTVSGRWLNQTAGDVGEALRREVLGLCLREALRRRIDRAPEALRPLSLALRCLGELHDAAPARDDALTLLRLALDGARTKLPHADEVLSRALEAAARAPALGALAVDLACGLEDDVLGIDAHVALLGRLWALRPAAALWLRALEIWSRAHSPDCEHAPPDWILDAAPRATADDAVVRRLLQGDHKAREVLVDWLETLAPPAEFDRLVDAVWDRADPALRRSLARAVAYQVMAPDAEAVLASLGGYDIEDVLDGLAPMFGGGPPPEPDRARLERHLPRMLGHHETFLLTAVDLARTQTDARKLVARFVQEGHPLETALAAIAASVDDPPGSRTRLIAPELCWQLRGDVAALARALPWLDRHAGTRHVLVEFANALLSADEASPGPRTEAQEQALARARQLTRLARKAPRKPAKPAKKPKAPTAPKTPKPAKPRMKKKAAPAAAPETAPKKPARRKRTDGGA